MFKVILITIFIILIIILCTKSNFIIKTINDEVEKNISLSEQENGVFSISYDKNIENINSFLTVFRKDILQETLALINDKEALFNQDFTKELLDKEYYKEKEYNPFWMIYKGQNSHWLSFIPTLSDILKQNDIKKCYLSIFQPGQTISNYIGNKDTLRYSFSLNSAQDFFILGKETINFDSGLIWNHHKPHYYANNGNSERIFLNIEIPRKLSIYNKILIKTSNTMSNIFEEN